MRIAALTFALFLCLVQSDAQIHGDLMQGAVSYRNPQNVYVKFNNTAQIAIGDTLYLLHESEFLPALVITHKSSISVVGVPFAGIQLEVSDILIYYPRITAADPEPDEEVVSDELPAMADVPVAPRPEEEVSLKAPGFNEKIRGRLSASFYSNVFSEVSTIQRLRYTFSLQAQNISASRFSAETFISFRHQLDDWKAVQVPRGKALRVYRLAVKYDINDRTVLTLGRNINKRIANIGVIDGLQAEHTTGQFVFGAFLGTRPDHRDYGWNAKLAQYGAFIAHQDKVKNGSMRSSLAIAEQRNDGMTDRRFVYFQQSVNLFRNVSMFSSFEFDLYQRIDTTPESVLHVTSLYFSLQYRPIKKLTLSGSYDARRNVIYYETFRNFIDELIEQETRQGLRFRANIRPVKYFSVGASLGYRFQKSHGNNSMNMHYNVTYSRVPWINASLSASVILIENSYLQGEVYGMRMSRDIIRQKLFGELKYRRVKYVYGSTELSIEQNLIGLNLSWRLQKKYSFGVDYEGTLQPQKTNHRLHLNAILRF